MCAFKRALNFSPEKSWKSSSSTYLMMRKSRPEEVTWPVWIKDKAGIQTQAAHRQVRAQWPTVGQGRCPGERLLAVFPRTGGWLGQRAAWYVRGHPWCLRLPLLTLIQPCWPPHSSSSSPGTLWPQVPGICLPLSQEHPPPPVHVHMAGFPTSFKSLLKCHLLIKNVLCSF